MPSFTLNTNLPRDKIPPNFPAEISKLLSKLTGKPESYITVAINSDQLRVFNGTPAPCASSTLEILGSVDSKKVTKEINGLIHEKLGIDFDRLFLFFYNLSGSQVGHGQSTFG
ncbi:hypothetical protein HELRODRAFT_180615 [Helobdella robusta]|uniref:L-dopachrome isomerase n=1 Tax=Helobdella robusta TaxID=6412 RepID=T1FG34_HELRO|nr:hypothetical protein HELRODRAFT_180615 [Helobdella robusta]ESN93749.1 hypothetical protein HELRODRAFT_180615 [Helobdella robusta]